MMKDKEAVSLLSALASEPRLAVFRLLVRRGPEGYTPSELSERLSVPAPTLSFHLKELMHAGLIASRRDGRNLFYSPDFDRMTSLVGFLTDSCCSLANDKCMTSCSPTTVAVSRKKTA
jgi:ArsR family transcriptional regulator